MLAMTLCTGSFSLIVAPRVGHLSDRYGRRRLLALASCGGLLGELVTILAAKYPQAVDYRWLILGATFDGMGGSFTAANILIQAYTSDCTAPSRRAVSMGFVHTCLFIGLAGGQLLGGYITKWSGSLLTVFYICIICHTVFVVFVGFVAPESVSARKRAIAREVHLKEKQEFAEKYGNSWMAVVRASNPFAPIQYLYPTGPGTSTRLRVNLAALAFCDMVILGSAMAAGQVIILYTEHMFLWGTFEASRFIAAISSVRVVVLMGIFPLVNYVFRILPRRRERERTGITPADKNAGADKLDIWVLRIALLSDILGNVGNVFARTPQLFLANAMVTALAGLGSATSQSAITKHVPESRVGRVLGAVGMLQALMRLAGPLVFNSLFAETVDSFPQAIFVALSSMFGAAFLASLILKPNGKQGGGPLFVTHPLTVLTVAWHDVDEEEAERLTDAQLVFNTRGNPPLDEDEIRI